MKARKILEGIFYFLLLLWVTIGILSVAYNTKKGFLEIKEWAPLSEDVKKQKLFGDYYSFYKFLKNNSNSEKIVLYTKDPMAFFLPRYFLYPQRIYWVTSENDFLSRLDKERAIKFFVYDSPLNTRDYTIVATFFSKSKKRGFLIKK